MNWYQTFDRFTLFFIIFAALFSVFLIIRFVWLRKAVKVRLWKVFAKIFLRALYSTLIIIALLGPLFGATKKKVKTIGKDIFIALDLSSSMNADDIKPTRLERVKFELKKLANTFPSDRLGLIIFSSEAYLQCPLTYDKGAFRMFIETLNTGLVPRQGTDFGPPLEMAYHKLLNAEEGEKPGNKTSKIIVLISDGEDFGKNTQERADEIQNAGIKILTLGVGTRAGSKIKNRNGYLTDRNGRVVVSHLKPDNLQEVAAESDGQYFEISAQKDQFDDLLSTIEGIKGQLQDTRTVDASANQYFYFLLAGMLLFLLDGALKFKIVKV